ncbi:MAG TPA: hypothetical protein DDW50_21115 [Firmicutes bacterium]|jgi:transcriptional regulator with XRE-family HTH domain|nr:hypothetical protein [Bacillota bacterium]
MNDNIDFGKYLSELRNRNNIETQRELADKSGLSTATISRIEAGLQKAKPEHLKKIAPYLKTPYEELMKAAGYLDEKNVDEEIKNSRLIKVMARAEELPDDKIKYVVNVVEGIIKAHEEEQNNTKK